MLENQFSFKEKEDATMIQMVTLKSHLYNNIRFKLKIKIGLFFLLAKSKLKMTIFFSKTSTM